MATKRRRHYRSIFHYILPNRFSEPLSFKRHFYWVSLLIRLTIGNQYLLCQTCDESNKGGVYALLTRMIFWSRTSFLMQFTKNAVVIAPRIKLNTTIIMTRWSLLPLFSFWNNTKTTFHIIVLLCNGTAFKYYHNDWCKWMTLTLHTFSASSFKNLQFVLPLHFKWSAMHVSSSQSNSSV